MDGPSRLEQSAPSGTQVLVLMVVPPPQVAEHIEYSLHADQVGQA